MLDFLLILDQDLFFYLNSLHHPILDQFMWLLSNKWSSIPLYILILFWLFQKFNTQTLWIMIGIGLSILFADQTCTQIKKRVQRFRPSNQIQTQEVHIVQNYRGGDYGFPSSHAANSMVVAIWVVLFRPKKHGIIGIFLWCFLVSYSRIYLGVHFPSDILAGWLIGAIYALLVFNGTQRIMNKLKNVNY